MGILVIVVGLVVGGVMVAAPRGIWWATESWKFRNPEANEPSEAAYGMSRVGGVIFVIVALVLGGSIISNDLADKEKREAKAQQEAAEAAFVAPPAQSRGLLPVIGYVTEYVPVGVAVRVYYTAPSRSVPGYVRDSTDRFTYPCASVPHKASGEDGRVDVTVELSWAPRKLADMNQDGDCRVGGGGELESLSLGVFPSAAPVITTSGPILAPGGAVAAAVPGTAVPELVDVPYRDGTVPVLSDRGVLPIVSYAVKSGYGGSPDDAKFLEVSYLVPENATIGEKSSSRYPARGCQVAPTLSGLGTPTVTVNVALRWSDAGGRPDTENSACRAAGSRMRVMASRWGEITDSTKILTDGPVADKAGVEVSAAAPGNQVPRS